MKTEKTIYRSLSNFVLVDYRFLDYGEHRYLLADRYNENIRVVYRLIEPRAYYRIYSAGKMSARLYKRMETAFIRFKAVLDAKRKDLLK